MSRLNQAVGRGQLRQGGLDVQPDDGESLDPAEQKRQRNQDR